MIFFRYVIFIYRLYFYLIDQRLVLEWLVIRINRINIEFLIFFDWVRILFISIVLFISSIVLIYRIVYIGENKFLIRYYLLVLIFVFSIVLIIISPNVIRVIIGWDGLGLVSFCLVVFYQNYVSYNSGILTVLTNRFGDVMILIVIGIIIIYGRWNIFIIKKIKLLMLFLLIAGITKSAQLPFSSWLPRAIAAPTPVSALVHSSTLVTAGVYLIIRFWKFLMINEVNYILMFISILTIFISGIIARFEFDLKKIIALSTLSQLGLIMIILRIGYPLLSFYHLLTHAIFKSLLFIRAGVIIHLVFNNQDIRIIGGLREYIPFTIIRFQLTLIALCGFPFFSGFYSKDLVMEIIYRGKFNLLMYILSLISLIFTVMYSIRLFYYIFFGEIKLVSLNYIYERKFIRYSMILLIILRIIVGSLIRWIFFVDEFLFLSIKIKILTLSLLFIGVILLFIFIKVINLIKIYLFLYFFSSIWFLNYLNIWLVKPLIKIRMQSYFKDKVWIEYYRKNFILNLYFAYKNKFINYNYKIFIFLFLFILVQIFILFI